MGHHAQVFGVFFGGGGLVLVWFSSRAKINYFYPTGVFQLCELLLSFSMG